MQQLIESLESRRFMAAGTLDTSFGNGGIAVIRAVDSADVGLPATNPIALRVDSGGRTLVLSRSAKSMNLTRLTADGTPDARFATASKGTIVFDAPTKANDGTPSTYRLQIDAFNRIYLLIDNTLYRFNSSGRRDNTFGERGRVSLANDRIRFVSKDMTQFGTNGDMLVVGAADDLVNGAGGRSVGVVHIDANGVAKYVLTAPQILVQPVSNFPGLYNPIIRQTPDGNVVVAATYRSSHQAGDVNFVDATGIESFRLNGKLALDKTYGKRGRALAFENSGRILPVGIRANGAVVGVRDASPNGLPNFEITPQGVYDDSRIDFGDTLFSAQFVRQTDGQEIVVNTTTTTLRRLNADNSIDNSFNRGIGIEGVVNATVGADGSIIFATTGQNGLDGLYDVRRVFAGEGPAARLVPTTLISPSRELPFRVVFRDDDGVDVDSITSQVLRVIAADGTTTRPVLTGVSESNGTVIADFVYRPADRRLNAADNGVFAVRLLSGRALDINGVTAEARTIGSLAVNIPSVA